MYFDKPTQVTFQDPDAEDGNIISGIAYRDEIICACCGGIIELSEVTNLKELSWISFSEELIGN